MSLTKRNILLLLYNLRSFAGDIMRFISEDRHHSAADFCRTVSTWNLDCSTTASCD